MKITLKSFILPVAATLAFAVPTMASALTIDGGTTSIRLDTASVITGAGGVIAPIGDAVLAGTYPDGTPVFTFPITGGTDTPFLMIEHAFSGLSITFGADTLLLGDLLIDGENLTLVGDLNLNGLDALDITLATLAPSGDGIFPIALNFSSDFAALLSNLSGEVFDVGSSLGLAVTNPTFQDDVPQVPAPPAIMLLGLGALALGFRTRR